MYEVRCRFDVDPEESDSDPEFVGSVVSATIRDALIEQGFAPVHGVTVKLRSPETKAHAPVLEVPA